MALKPEVDSDAFFPFSLFFLSLPRNNETDETGVFADSLRNVFNFRSVFFASLDFLANIRDFLSGVHFSTFSSEAEDM